MDYKILNKMVNKFLVDKFCTDQLNLADDLNDDIHKNDVSFQSNNNNEKYNECEEDIKENFECCEKDIVTLEIKENSFEINDTYNDKCKYHFDEKDDLNANLKAFQHRNIYKNKCCSKLNCENFMFGKTDELRSELQIIDENKNKEKIDEMKADEGKNTNRKEKKMLECHSEYNCENCEHEKFDDIRDKNIRIKEFKIDQNKNQMEFNKSGGKLKEKQTMMKRNSSKCNCENFLRGKIDGFRNELDIISNKKMTSPDKFLSADHNQSITNNKISNTSDRIVKNDDIGKGSVDIDRKNRLDEFQNIKGDLSILKADVNKNKSSKRVVSSLKELIEETHKLFESNNINVEEIKELMESYASNYDDWKQFAKFSDSRYTRNLVDHGNDKFNLIILCWGKGQTSSIHDHADAHCFMKMLQGSLLETRYEMPSLEQPLQTLDQTVLNVNDVCYINDSIGLHKVGNEGPHEKSVSLHLYSPPFSICSSFDGKTGQKTSCEVTFWSKFGDIVK